MSEVNAEKRIIGIPFKKGNKAAVGHGGGAARAARMRAAIQRVLSRKDAEEIVQAQIGLALEGDTVAAKFVFDYCGCKPTEEVSMTTNSPALAISAQIQAILADRVAFMREVREDVDAIIAEETQCESE